MRIACKDPDFAKKVDIPQDVACEFKEADEKEARKPKKSEKGKD